MGCMTDRSGQPTTGRRVAVHQFGVRVADIALHLFRGRIDEVVEHRADQAAFVAEVARVLRPGGIFSWADIRAEAMMPLTEQAFSHPDLELISSDTLTPGVLRALDMLSERKASRIARVPLISGFLREFAATKGTTLYKAFAEDEATYLARRYRRR